MTHSQDWDVGRITFLTVPSQVYYFVETLSEEAACTLQMYLIAFPEICDLQKTYTTAGLVLRFSQKHNASKLHTTPSIVFKQLRSSLILTFNL